MKMIKLTEPELFNIIPKYLFEQVEGRSYTVDRLYKLAPFVVNTNHFMWVYVNDENEIKGVLWITLDILSEKVNVIVFSTDKEYEISRTEVLEFLRDFIAKFNENSEYVELKDKVNWVTNEPDSFKELGGKVPETVLVEV